MSSSVVHTPKVLFDYWWLSTWEQNEQMHLQYSAVCIEICLKSTNVNAWIDSFNRGNDSKALTFQQLHIDSVSIFMAVALSAVRGENSDIENMKKMITEKKRVIWRLRRMFRRGKWDWESMSRGSNMSWGLLRLAQCWNEWGDGGTVELMGGG